MSLPLNSPDSELHSRNDDLSSGTVCRHGVEDFALATAKHLRIGAVQLEGGEFRCHSDYTEGAATVLCHEQFARSVHISCEVQNGWMALGIPVGGAELRFNGDRVRGSFVALMVPGCQGEWFIGAGASVMFVVAESRHLLPLIVSPEKSKALGRLDQCAVLRVIPGMLESEHRAFCALLESGLRGASGGAGPFDRGVLAGFARLIDFSAGKFLDPSPAASLVRRAKELLADEPWTFRATVLSRKLLVSPRTLYAAFKAVTGISPQSYFLCLRYTAVRKALLRAVPQRGLVTEIALQHGFTELGRFACRYRELFGETPSATLARSRDTPAGNPCRGGSPGRVD